MVIKKTKLIGNGFLFQGARSSHLSLYWRFNNTPYSSIPCHSDFSEIHWEKSREVQRILKVLLLECEEMISNGNLSSHTLVYTARGFSCYCFSIAPSRFSSNHTKPAHTKERSFQIASINAKSPTHSTFGGDILINAVAHMKLMQFSKTKSIVLFL